MIRSLLITLLLLFISGCTKQPNVQLVKANPEAGYNFQYFLFIPEEIDSANTNYLIVEPNNSGFVSDDMEEHIESAAKVAEKDFYLGNFLAGNLNYPLLVPVFPRPKTDWKIYTHALDRDVMLQKDNELERIDLQLLAMIKDASQRLRVEGITIHPKIVMTGFSASGTFVNRFSMIHPEKIIALAAGGVNGLLMIPADSLKGEVLNFPLGTNDFEEVFGYQFKLNEYKSLPKYLFMGAEDNNDAIPYDDGYAKNERKVVYKALGKEMMPLRWNECIKVYKELSVEGVFKTYDGIGHEVPANVKMGILEFVKVHLKD